MLQTPIAALRAQIDQIDEQLIELLAQRFRVTAEVGLVKKELGLHAVDAEREARQSAAYRALAVRHGLSPALVESLFRLVIDRVVADHLRL